MAHVTPILWSREDGELQSRLGHMVRLSQKEREGGSEGECKRRRKWGEGERRREVSPSYTESLGRMKKLNEKSIHSV